MHKSTLNKYIFSIFFIVFFLTAALYYKYIVIEDFDYYLQEESEAAEEVEIELLEGSSSTES